MRGPAGFVPVSAAALICVVLIQVLAFLIYTPGLFPPAQILEGHASVSDYGDVFPDLPLDRPVLSDPHWKGCIFLLIDALRPDFVYEERTGFRFTRKLLREGHGRAYVAEADAPTVTRPRLKAILTGSIPTFLDSWQYSSAKEGTYELEYVDSWLYQVRNRANLRPIFFGDDTWLSLLPPDIFERAEGVVSLFASDTVIVDLNVTRGLGPELKEQGKWDIMILHYLGLDHIGHSVGPMGPLMDAKQREMDGIIEKLWSAVSLPIVVLGDHGMTDLGNHGGSTPKETAATFLILFPPDGKYDTRVVDSFPVDFWAEYPSNSRFSKIQQTQIAPTISALFGVPLPKSNVAKVLFELLPDEDREFWVQANAKQVANLLKGLSGSVSKNMVGEDCSRREAREDALCLLSHYHRAGNDTLLLEGFLDDAGQFFRHSSRGANPARLALGLFLMTCTLLFIHMKSSLRTHPEILAGYALNGIALFTSSYVESEHQLLHFLTTTALVLRLFKALRARESARDLFWVLLSFGIARRWDPGQYNDANQSSIRYLVTVMHPWMGIALFLVGMGFFSFKIATRSRTRLSAILGLGSLVGIAVYQMAVDMNLWYTEYSVELARLTFGLTALYALMEGEFYFPLSMLLPMFVRSHNVALLALVQFMVSRLAKAGHTSAIYFLSQSSFFFFGNSNSLSTIDISHSFTGLREFSFILTGLFTTIANWAGPISVGHHHLGGTLWTCWCTFMTLFVFRHHLLVWNVFSPRIIYEMAWFAVKTPFWLAYKWGDRSLAVSEAGCQEAIAPGLRAMETVATSPASRGAGVRPEGCS